MGSASLRLSKAPQSGADNGTRTRDLRFTKPLLYQLSYVGAIACGTLSRLLRRLKAFQP